MIRNVRIFFITAASVIIADQATKAYIAARLWPNQVIEAVPGVFNIVYLKNPGAAFGILNEGGSLRRVILAGVSVAALAVIGFLVRESKDRLTSFSLSLIAGGAVGNLIDRVRFGEVVDFLDFHIGAYHWPAFNVADSAITVGVILAAFSYYLKPRRA
ncbi:MAG: signal peptidase II [Deltaproteobacteria bacterium]|nr:signal peptidase II [Deltaproteobacteria bacterium]